MMRVLGMAYVLGAVIFFFLSKELIAALNFGPGLLHFFQPLQTTPDHFWSHLAGALFGLLAAICFLAAESPYTKGYALVHLLAKMMIVLAFLSELVTTPWSQGLFAYWAVLLVDLPVLFLAAWVLIRLPFTKPQNHPRTPPQGEPSL
jgi:hypothetical protein